MASTPSSCYIFDSARRIIICRTCMHAVPPGIPALKAHQRLSHATFFSIVQWLAWISTFPHENAISKSDTAALLQAQSLGWSSDLRTRSLGYQCAIADCPYASPQQNTMRRHINDVHSASATDASAWKYPVPISTIFGSGQSPWFSVTIPNPPEELQERNLSSAFDRFDTHNHNVSLQGSHIPSQTDPRHIDLWAQLTQYHSHFADMNMMEQSDLAGFNPRPKDPANLLIFVRSMVPMFIMNLHHSAKGQLTTLLKIVRKINHEPSFKPLRTVFDDTVPKYCTFWVHFLLYLLRTYSCASEHRYAVTEALHQILHKCEQAIVKEDSGAFQGYLPTLVLTLLEERITTEKLRSPLLHFFGIAGWSRTTYTFKDAFDIRPTFSHAVYVCRLVALAHAVPTHSDSTTSKAEALENYCSQHLRADTPGPFGEIQFLRERAKAIGTSYYVHPTINWWPSRNGLCYRGMSICLEKLFAAVQNVLSVTEELIISDLLFSADGSFELDIYNPETIEVEDMNWRSLRHSFVNFQENKLMNGHKRVLKRAGRCLRGSRLFEPTDSNKEFSPAHVETYLRSVHTARQKLAFLIHVLGGLPARGTEIATVQYCNSQLSLRNVYIRDGLVLILIEYNKTDGVTEEPKVIGRYLPWRLSRLLVMFIADIIPFSEFLEIQLQHEVNVPRSTFLFQTDNVPWSSEKFSQILADEFERGLGLRLGLAKWRDVIIAIDQECLRSRLDMTLVDRDFIMHTLMTGHGRTKEKHHYAQRTERTIVNADPQTLKRWFEVCQLVHKLFDVYKEPVHLTISDEPFWTKRLLPATIAASDHTTRKRNPSSTLPARDNKKARRSESPSISNEVSAVSVDPLEILRQIHPDASFKAGQRESIEAIMTGQHVLSILPTGGGKGEIMLIPAVLDSDRITLVVVPTNALKNQLSQRCSALGISCAIWNSQMFDSVSVVLVVPETTLSESFSTYIATVAASGRLARIVLDEAQQYIYDASWRKSLTQMTWLHRVKHIQRVLLTGSLPPTVELELQLLMAFTPFNSTTIRIPTTRRNISFHVRQTFSLSVANIEPLLTKRIAVGERCIIFTKSRSEHQPLCSALSRFHALSYHGGDMSAETQADVIRRFEAGESSVIVATTALATGVDLKRIGLVIFWDGCFTLIDMAQQSGRAGRHGESAQALIILSQRAMRGLEASIAREQQELYTFLTTTECRLRVLSKYLDGDSKSCLRNPSFLMCDNCQAKSDSNFHPSRIENFERSYLSPYETEDPKSPVKPAPFAALEVDEPARTHVSNSTDSNIFTPHISAMADESISTLTTLPSSMSACKASTPSHSDINHINRPMLEDGKLISMHVDFSHASTNIVTTHQNDLPVALDTIDEGMNNRNLDHPFVIPAHHHSPHEISSENPITISTPPSALQRHTYQTSAPSGHQTLQPLHPSVPPSVASFETHPHTPAPSITPSRPLSNPRPSLYQHYVPPSSVPAISLVSHVSDSQPLDASISPTVESTRDSALSLAFPSPQVGTSLFGAWRSLAASCFACWLDMKEQRDHTWTQCQSTMYDSRDLTHFASAIRNNVNNKMNLDWSCFLPMQAIAHAKSGTRCKYRDLLPSLLLLASERPNYQLIFAEFDTPNPLPKSEAELNAATHELMRSLSPVSYQFKLVNVFAAILDRRAQLAQRVSDH